MKHAVDIAAAVNAKESSASAELQSSLSVIE